MNNKVNYSLVGIIVLSAIALVLAFGYWLLKPTDDEMVRKYTIYFNESVFGLNIDAPVKYRGISVGKVSKLKINPKNSEQVEVTITILNDTPIKENTVAKLTAQGITGLSYINLSLGRHNAPKLKAKAGEKYPVIKSIPSFFEDLENSFGMVSSKLSNTLVKTEELLKDENQKHFTQLLSSSSQTMQRINTLLDDNTITHLQSTIAHLDSTSKQLDKMMPKIEKFLANSTDWEDNIKASFYSIAESFISIQDSMRGIKDATWSGVKSFDDQTQGLVPTLDNTLLEMQQLMIKIEGTLNQYERSPSDILFKSEARKLAPGEK